MPEELLLRTRELIDGIYHCVHVSKDGRIRVNLGPEHDQRPNPDGITVFLPIEVATIDRWGGENPYIKQFHCGKCRKQMAWGEEYRLYECCPRCGAKIGYWQIDGMQKEKWKEGPKWERPPDYWPVTLDGFGSGVSLEDARLLSDATANVQASIGNGSASEG